MKKAVLSLVVAGLLAGCSTAEKKPAPIVDSSQQDAAARAAAAKAAADKAAVEANALNQSRLSGQANGGSEAENLFQNSIYFQYNQYDVSDQYHSVLEADAAYLNAHPNVKVTLQGNTDDRGSAEYNLALGQRRADAVRKALNLLGVPEAQMEAVSFGKEKPRAEGDDESAWKQNRRTDIVPQSE
ncbi:MAG: peptidoglycan-associated lipoprotein Pal [Burkholderiales bacterium]